MRTPSKGVEPTERLGPVLERIAACRLAVLEGKDPEALHDFRVALRRLRTCLRLLEGRYPSGRLDPILLFLKRTADSTNALRDQEVLCVLWRSLPSIPDPTQAWRNWLGAQETALRRQESKVRMLLASPGFTRKFLDLKKALRQPAGSGRPPDAVERAFKKERRKLAKVLRMARHDRPSGPLLHKLRVRVKRIRYALEEFEFLMPRRGRELAIRCRKVQDALGEWRDLDRAVRVLREGGPGRSREAGPWIGELDARKAVCWERVHRAFRTLLRALG